MLSFLSNTFNQFIKNATKTSRDKSEEVITQKELEDNLQGLDDLIKQSSSYNEYIPLVFGTTKLAGNIIWTGRLKSYVQKEGGASYANTLHDTAMYNIFPSAGGVDMAEQFSLYKSTTAEFSSIYKADFAIAICEGKVDEIFSVQVGDEELDMSKYKHRVYYGSKTQEVDPLLEDIQGVGKTPAFRGLCYIVFEEFPISDFGNRIPNFIFSVRRTISQKSDDSISQLVKGVTLIPGTGEFVYHTEKVTKFMIKGTRNGDILLTDTAEAMNYHNNTQNTNVVLSLDNLQKQLPNLEWISVVVCWFGDSLDIESCNIYPACEFNEYNMSTRPYEWFVAKFSRHNARVISKDSEGSPRYGGTPSDSSVISLLQELKDRGYKINLLPMLMMDCNNKPWRGRLTGNASEVANFFNKTNGFNTFIRHYADLCKNYIDSFVIGTEMVGLTKINDGTNQFPAVDEFCELAKEVRNIVGNDIQITYAADWSEYHHTVDGFYNMDKLWASENIDFIGIDAYFPLTNTTVKPTINEIKKGWEAGEGWDFYCNEDRTQTFSLEQKWAWKNIRWFIENIHINVDGTQTEWQPNMKKVQFIEYGFPSVDLCTNQPNVFYDPTSSESALPRNSNGYVDYESQNDAIIATEQYWNENSDIVENKFLWTWDARPYPFFPRLKEVWSDYSSWQYGHWINGKSINSYIKNIVYFLCEKSGIENFQIEKLDGIVHGMVIKGNKSIKNLIKDLTTLYNFRVFSGKHNIIMRDIKAFEEQFVNENSIIIDEENAEMLDFTKIKGTVFKRFILYFYDINKNHTVNHVYFEDTMQQNGKEYTVSIPFVLSTSQAEEIARKGLRILNSVSFQEITLPATEEFKEINGGKIIRILGRNFYGIVENIIQEDDLIKLNILDISKDVIADFSTHSITEANIPQINYIIEKPLPKVEIIDTYTFTNTSIQDGIFPLYFAFEDVPKQGLSLYYSTDNGTNFSKMFEIYQNSTMGQVISYQHHDVHKHTMDTINTIEVLLFGNSKLQNITSVQLLANENLCIIGNELCNFQNAIDISSNETENISEISYLLRGRFNTRIENEAENKRFILMDQSIRKFNFEENINRILFKAVPHGSEVKSVDAIEYIPEKHAVSHWNIHKIYYKVEENGDIIITWYEQSPFIKSLFSPSKTHLKTFYVNINNNRFETVIGKHSFVYTREMQITDNFTDEPLITVKEL